MDARGGGHMVTKEIHIIEKYLLLIFFYKLSVWFEEAMGRISGEFESFCTIFSGFSFLSFLCKQSANLCSWPKTDKEPRQAMSRTISNLRLNQKLKAQMKRFLSTEKCSNWTTLLLHSVASLQELSSSSVTSSSLVSLFLDGGAGRQRLS